MRPRSVGTQGPSRVSRRGSPPAGHHYQRPYGPADFGSLTPPTIDVGPLKTEPPQKTSWHKGKSPGAGEKVNCRARSIRIWLKREAERDPNVAAVNQNVCKGVKWPCAWWTDPSSAHLCSEATIWDAGSRARRSASSLNPRSIDPRRRAIHMKGAVPSTTTLTKWATTVLTSQPVRRLGSASFSSSSSAAKSAIWRRSSAAAAKIHSRFTIKDSRSGGYRERPSLPGTGLGARSRAGAK